MNIRSVYVSLTKEKDYHMLSVELEYKEGMAVVDAGSDMEVEDEGCGIYLYSRKIGGANRL